MRLIALRLPRLRQSQREAIKHRYACQRGPLYGECILRTVTPTDGFVRWFWTALQHHIRRCGLVLACLLVGALATISNARAEGVLKASGHPNWPPFSWQKGDLIIGIIPEFAQIIFNDLDLSVSFVPTGNWKRVQVEAAAGHLDVIVGIYRTEERSEYLAYPETPIMEDSNVVWVMKGKTFAFNKWEDLVGKRGTAMVGESYGEKFDQFIKQKLTISRVNTPFQNLKMLELGRSEYYPFSLYGGQIQLKQLGFDSKIEHLPQVISTENIYLGITKKSPFIRYLPQIEAAIKKRRDDGTLDRLVRKYIALAADSAAGFSTP